VHEDLDSSLSSSDRTDSSGAATEEVEDEDAEIDVAKTASDEETVVAEVASDDEATATNASFGEEGAVAEASIDEDIVSMYELEAAEAFFDNVPVASASNPRSVERVSDEHTTAGAVTSAVRTAEAEPIAITSSGGTAQDNPSRSDSHTDPSLFDSSPSTCHYVRRARKGSIVSTDSERTILATPVVPTPSSPPRESSGAASTPVVIATVVFVATIVQEDETVPTAAEVTPSSEEVLVHISNILEGNVVEDTPVDENLVVGTDFGTNVTQTGCAEAATSENPILADVLPGSDILVVEGTFAQDPADDISMEDMADTHDSYDAVLADTGDHVAGIQAADLGVTALAATHMSPTKTGNWLLISILLFFCLMAWISLSV
jgi:hypothetical protein